MHVRKCNLNEDKAIVVSRYRPNSSLLCQRRATELLLSIPACCGLVAIQTTLSASFLACCFALSVPSSFASRFFFSAVFFASLRRFFLQHISFCRARKYLPTFRAANTFSFDKKARLSVLKPPLYIIFSLEHKRFLLLQNFFKSM